MRLKVQANKKAKATPISLYPHQKDFASKKSFALGMSLSRYVQLLIQQDRAENAIARAISANAENAKAA